MSDIDPDRIDLVKVVASTGGAALIAGVILLFRHVRGWIYNKIKRLLRGKAHNPFPTRQQVYMDRIINDRLIEVKTAVNADRARFWQFHNGQVFSSANPMWRISVTHEACKPGISHEMDNTKFLFSSQFCEFLNPLFNGELESGVRRLGLEKSKTNRKTELFWISVNDLSEGFCKSLLNSQGVSFIATSNVVNDSGIIGFITVEFVDDPDQVDFKKLAFVCQTASTIAFELKRGAQYT